MFCTKCGKECKEEMRFCPFCGEPITPPVQPPFNQYNGQQNGQQYGYTPPQSNGQPYRQPYGQQPPYQQPYGQPYYAPPPPPPVTPVHMALKNVFASDAFKVACIINIIQAIISFLSSESIPIIPLLVAAIMWSLHDMAKKNEHPIKFAEKLKIVKIIAIIEYVFMWIAVGVLAIAGFILGIVIPDLVSGQSFEILGEPWASILEILFENGFVLTLAFLVVAFILALYNVFFIGNCLKLAKSAEHSCRSGLMVLESVDTVSKWFYVLGILNAISAITSFTSLFSEMPMAINIVLFIASLVSGTLSAVFYIYLHKCLKMLKEQLGFYNQQY